MGGIEDDNGVPVFVEESPDYKLRASNMSGVNESGLNISVNEGAEMKASFLTQSFLRN